MYAACIGNFTVVKLLVYAGADIDTSSIVRIFPFPA
jgi:hypothetical protein